MLTAINPANGKTIKTYEENIAQEVEDKVKAADPAFLTWRETTFPQRVEKLRNASRVLIDKKEEYAALIATEMGKPIWDGRAKIEKSAWVCDFYADNALTALQPESIETDARKSYVSFNPLGVILAIMPWNYPFWLVFRFAAPALLAGNAADEIGRPDHPSEADTYFFLLKYILHRIARSFSKFLYCLMSGIQKQINFSNEFRQGCRKKAVAEDVALSMHPHPTLSEGEEESAEVFLGSATHILGRRKNKAGSD